MLRSWPTHRHTSISEHNAPVIIGDAWLAGWPIEDLPDDERDFMFHLADAVHGKMMDASSRRSSDGQTAKAASPKDDRCLALVARRIGTRLAASTMRFFIISDVAVAGWPSKDHLVTSLHMSIWLTPSTEKWWMPRRTDPRPQRERSSKKSSETYDMIRVVEPDGHFIYFEDISDVFVSLLTRVLTMEIDSE